MNLTTPLTAAVDELADMIPTAESDAATSPARGPSSAFALALMVAGILVALLALFAYDTRASLPTGWPGETVTASVVQFDRLLEKALLFFTGLALHFTGLLMRLLRP